MAIMNALMNVAKARAVGRLMRGRFGGALLALWAGKKMYDYVQSRKRQRARVSSY
jgi:hypothetical protein